MTSILIILQSVSAVVLIFLILIQAKGKGFARSLMSGNVSFTRRGLERVVFKLTFAIAGIFMLLSVLILII